MKIILTSALFTLWVLISGSVFAAEQWVVLQSDMRDVTITGFTRARATMPLISEVSGKVRKIFADVGEPIPETGRFACLDDTFVDIDIKSAQSEISRHGVDIKFLKKEVSRHERLVKTQTSAVSVKDALVRDLGKARQMYSSAVIKKQRLEELKRRHCVGAPPGWLITDRKIEPGQWVNEGQILAHAGNFNQLIIPVSLSHPELASLKQNKDKLRVVFPELGENLPAKIEHISPGFDEETRKILVDLLIEDTPKQIQGGMRAEVLLNIADKKSTSFKIPKQALEERFEEYWLERLDGQRFRVKLISNLGDGMVRISSSELHVGDKFKVRPSK